MATTTTDKTRELLDQVKAGVQALVTGDDWRRYLETQATFHRYSFGNVMLILEQRPTSTRVAGFNAWKKLGRYVKKGEKGIAILAPLVRKVRRDDEPEAGGEVVRAEDKKADDEAPRTVFGFRTVYVFDVEQTEGEALPSLVSHLEGQDDAARDAFAVLRRFAEEDLGIPVSVEAIEGAANGYLMGDAQPRIVIRQDRAPLQQAKTLAHELGHALLHLGTECHDRPAKEVEAESVAFCVMRALGFNTSAYTFGYVAGWASGDAEAVTRSGQSIQRAVARILDAVLMEDVAEVAA